MANKKCTIHVPFECSLIECKSKDCNMKFILHVVITSEKRYECDHEPGDAIMPQSAVYYCPYCGEKQAIDRGKQKEAVKPDLDYHRIIEVDKQLYREQK